MSKNAKPPYPEVIPFKSKIITWNTAQNGTWSFRHTSNSAQDTFDLGVEFGKKLQWGDIVLLHGNLGSGKTCFTQGVGQGLGIEEVINSPTYIYMHTYPFSLNQEQGLFCHLDLYRVEEIEKLFPLGVEDLLMNSKTIMLVEWPEILIPILEKTSGKRFFRISLKKTGDSQREIRGVCSENYGKGLIVE